MRRVQEFNEGDDIKINSLLTMLSRSLELAKETNCPKLAEKIRLALSSAKGAKRNIGYRAGYKDLKAAGLA